MKLFEIINHLKSMEQIEKLIANEIPGIEVELVDVYLREVLDIESEVKFFDVDTIPNNLEINVDGTSYINLFPLAMLQDMVTDYLKSTDKLSDKDIAQHLIDYRLRDS